jgi:hypothetical protein
MDDDEIINKANRFFKRVGSAVKTAGKEAVKGAKTVTGVGRGHVRVALDSTRAAPGGELRGKVLLELPEPVEAKKLVVELRATQRGVENRGGVRSPTSTTIYRFEAELAGPRRYQREELPFTLTVPRDVGGGRVAPPPGTLGDVARAVSSLVSPTTGPVEWRVTASLVISFGRDLEHAVDVAVA